MQRLRLSDVRANVANVAELNTDDPRIPDYVNRAQERLLYRGKWVGTYGRYRVCISSGCITLPRNLETIEAAALCNVPATIRGEWYEFLTAGPGIVGADNCLSGSLIDRGEACCFDDPIGANNKLAVYTDRVEETNEPINLQFYDANGRWVRTSWEGEFVDGENINFPATAGQFTLTTNLVATNGFIRASKPVTNGNVRIFQYNLSTGLYRPLAIYEPDETIPVYRRYYVPGITNQNEDSESGDQPCAVQTLDITGKLRFIPVRRDADYLMIGHYDALRLMVQAIRKEENNLFVDARNYENQAVVLLDQQLRHYKGDGEVQPIAMLGSEITGPAVMNMI